MKNEDEEVKEPKKRVAKKKNEEIVSEEVNKEVEEVKVEKKKKTKNSHVGVSLAIILTFIACLLAFGLFYKFYLKNIVVETTKIVKDVTVNENGIADAVEKVYDSVVVVETYSGNQKYSSGTGFVFKTDDKYGYIITNHHVIANGNNVKVMFTNDEQVTAQIVGSDEYADIAILAVEKEHIISVADTGKSEDMRLGDTTFAVGAPIDSDIYSWSVTRGILSGKDRVVEVSDSSNRSTIIMKVLQTDTPINAGNSGGPLCNSNGQVIGVTNMKLSSSQIEGIGFAIPIEDALRYAEKIINQETIERPYLGVSVYDANGFFNSESGVYIQYVETGSLAEKAGLRKGDKILRINDVGIGSSAYFRYELYKYDIGDKITIKIERNKKEMEFEITLTGKNEIN